MRPELDLDDFDYPLPPECIAQQPTPERDGARMLVLDRAAGTRQHSKVRALAGWLRPGDLLVVNATRVLPARLRGRKASGGHAEALLLARAPGGEGRFRALVKARGRLRPGWKLHFEAPDQAADAEVVELAADGSVVLAFEPGVDPYRLGETPLPPYIRREAACAADAERYQTAYARVPGSVAAPTAGLHLSQRLLAELTAAGVERAEVVLHVGAGTFRPVRPEDLACRRLHAEQFELSQDVAARVERTRQAGGRVVAVGTTSARVLETCAAPERRVAAARGSTELFLAPGDRFQVVDALLTNFHLPRSSLLLLVAAFAGRSAVLDAYAEAIDSGYRFYSYGDAMLLL